MAFRLRWPTQYDSITQYFQENPEVYSKFSLPGHEGLDFMAPEGSPIYAAADGTVSEVRLDGDTNPRTAPYGNQVRIKHPEGFETIYAHLSQVQVTPGQTVKAGDVIGKAGNTGNSRGAHLHLTLKKKGATAAGETAFNNDIIDPIPYLAPYAPELVALAARPSISLRIESPEIGFLNLRSLPSTAGVILAKIPHDTRVIALDPEAEVRSKIGQKNQWVRVRTADNKEGYAAAWYLSIPVAAPAPVEPPAEIPSSALKLKVASPDVGYLNVRSTPATAGARLAQVMHGAELIALDPEATVRQRVGRRGQWLRIRTPNGHEGYVAAQYLRLPGLITLTTPYVCVDSLEYGLKIRSGPGTDQPQIAWVPHETPLESLEDLTTTASKLGQQDNWLRVRTPARHEGYTAAWYLAPPAAHDNRGPVSDEVLPYGISAHIFGMHMAGVNDDPGNELRALFQRQGKKGWVLFTQAIGSDPAAHRQPDPEQRNRLWEWSQQGYGIIVRLNHSYHPDGTLPESSHYENFAETCARWVEIYLKHGEMASSKYTWVIQIANEMNNPSEHPGGRAAPRERLTPDLYAQAFNRVYSRIKAVLPNAIVVPGAIDPYNAEVMPPLEYFQQMLSRIPSLDGFVLHAYTHGPGAEKITHLRKFGPPLEDHYYDFQTYRQFMERIPGKWKRLPVLITETNHVTADMANESAAFGWIDQDAGWVQAAYAEINRWNQTPYAQQILGLLLYRWTGDRWAVHDKPEVLKDFQKALANDYRWRRPPTRPAPGASISFAVQAASGWPALQVVPVETEGASGISMAAAPGKPDDLERLLGVGRKSAAWLRAMGIESFAKLSAMDPHTLQTLFQGSGIQGRFVTTWPEQARMILRGDWAALTGLQNRLTAKRNKK